MPLRPALGALGLALGLAGCVAPPAAPPTPRSWPDVDTWSTTLTVSPAGAPLCQVISLLPNEDAGIAFAQFPANARLVVYHPVRPEGPPQAIELLVDRLPFRSFPVNVAQTMPDQPGQWLLAADLPGDSLTTVVLPRLRQAELLTVEAGRILLRFDARRFAEVAAQMEQCIALMRGRRG